MDDIPLGHENLVFSPVTSSNFRTSRIYFFNNSTNVYKHAPHVLPMQLYGYGNSTLSPSDTSSSSVSVQYSSSCLSSASYIHISFFQLPCQDINSAKYTYAHNSTLAIEATFRDGKSSVTLIDSSGHVRTNLSDTEVTKPKRVQE